MTFPLLGNHSPDSFTTSSFSLMDSSSLLFFSDLVCTVCHHLLLNTPPSPSSYSQPSPNAFEFLPPCPPYPSLVLQSTCDTLRSHSDSLGFTSNMLPRHPTVGNFEEFACWRLEQQARVGPGKLGLDSILWSHMFKKQTNTQIGSHIKKTPVT